MKEKVKNFWKEHKAEIVLGVCVASGITCMYFLGSATNDFRVNVGLNRIADVTPELTFGEFKKQVITKTFDRSKYF